MNFHLSYIPCKCSHPTGHLSHVLLTTSLDYGRIKTATLSLIDRIFLLLEIEPESINRLTYTLCPVSLIAYVSSISTERVIDQYQLFQEPIHSGIIEGTSDFLRTTLEISEKAWQNQSSCRIVDRMIEMTKRQARLDALNDFKPSLALTLMKNQNDLSDELLAVYWRIYDLHYTE